MSDRPENDHELREAVRALVASLAECDRYDVPFRCDVAALGEVAYVIDRAVRELRAAA